MPNLFPEDYDETELDETEEIETDEPRYKRSIYFDFSTGDVRRDGSMRLVECTEEEAWIQWCIKCLSTPRYNCEAYSTDIGIEVEEAFHASDREEAESILTLEISEALSADPSNRTAYVESIEYEWISDTEVDVAVVVVGEDGALAEISARLSA